MQPLHNRWALITGASRGVGFQIAKALAGLGCNLLLHSRKAEHTASLVKELRALGGQAHSLAADLSEQHEVETLLDQIQAEFPPIDILYNNAAIMTPWRNNPWDIPAEDFRRSFEVNVISLTRICYRLVPPMLERGYGRVINVTSGIANEPQLTPYALSKAAVDKFVRDFAPSLRDTGVSMTLLDPGWLRTDLGGPQAPNDPSSVIPGALVPALLDASACGKLFRAQDYSTMNLTQALKYALDEA